MCGIAGIIGDNWNRELQGEIEKMTDQIIHRGPDGVGYYEDDKFVFGHRRLSIIDLSDLGKQPMEYMDRYVITYNGEIYNYLELREDLLQRGYSFKSNTDTEVLLASYDCWREKCLEHFKGMWAFALYDKQQRIFFCARDRFGIKPFYYWQSDGIFAFASEIKQFTVLRNWEAIANNRCVVDFITFLRFNETHETMFLGVYQLKGGEYLSYDLDKREFCTKKWYNVSEHVEKVPDTFEQAIEKFRSLFQRSVELHLRSDVKIGSCLSGGLDSSSIVCMMDKLLSYDHGSTNMPPEVVSYCSEDVKNDEQEYMDEVIKRTKITSHKVFANIETLFEDIDCLVWHQDEPFLSSSIFAQWVVFKEAKKQKIKVLLDGQGADEYLCGYPSFYKIFFYELLKKGAWSRLKKERLDLQRLGTAPQVSNLMLFGCLFPIKMRRILLGISDRLVNKKWFKISYNSKNSVVENPYSYKDIMNYSCNRLTGSLSGLLHYEDRNSMAQSVESRIPFLDNELVEYALGLPSCYKINKGRTKYILRESLKDILPIKIRERYDKIGFQTPEEQWIREHKDIFRQEIINICDILHVIIDKEKTLKWFDAAVSDNKPFGYLFWPLICLGRWSKVFNVRYEL